MHGDPTFVILKHQTWLDTSIFEDKILGAIVKEFLRPTNNYVPDSPLQYTTHDLVKTSFTDFVLDTSASKGGETSGLLGSIAGVSFKGNTGASVHLRGKFIRCKRLQQHDQFWTRLKTDPTFQAIVPGWTAQSKYAVWPACLVVGIMICEDVELSFETNKSKEREAHGEVPLETISLAVGVPNPQAKLASNMQTATIFKAQTGQSKIFALELKVVGTKGWRAKELVLKGDVQGVDPTRQAGRDGEEDDGPTVAHDVVLREFDDEDYQDMEE